MTLPDNILSFLQSNTFSVVDAGARNGVIDFAPLAQWIKADAFEPDAEEAHRLEKTRNVYASYHVHPFALAGAAGKRMLHLTRKRSFSSFLTFDEKEFLKYFGRMTDHAKWMDGFETERSLEIDCVTLDELFHDTTIDYLKLDTQGTELEILNGAAQLLKNKQISIVEVEVNMQPVYKGQPTFSVIDLFLREAGFLLVDYRINQYAFSAAKSKATIENPRIANGGDAVYVLNMELLTTNEQKKRVLKAALLLAHKGYLSTSEYLLEKFTATNKKEADKIFAALNRKTGKKRRKELIRNWLPPTILGWLKSN
ncbi:MAG: FkbM family methyltransferase [Bacteroidia bacterium]